MATSEVAGGTQTASGEGVGAGGTEGVKAPSAGAGGDGKNGKRRPPNKAVPEDATRHMKMYRFTKHELNLVTSPQKDASRAMAIAAFSAGVVVTTINSFSFGKPKNSTVEAAWIILGIIATIMGVYYWLEAKRLRKKAEADIEEIKNEHKYESDRTR
jgi:hypothetical protein